VPFLYVPLRLRSLNCDMPLELSYSVDLCCNLLNFVDHYENPRHVTTIYDRLRQISVANHAERPACGSENLVVEPPLQLFPMFVSA
jgi:hypothetical protein